MSWNRTAGCREIGMERLDAGDKKYRVAGVFLRSPWGMSLPAESDLINVQTL